MSRPLARLALASWLAGGCFHDPLPQLTGTLATAATDDPGTTSTPTTSTSTTTTTTPATTSTTDPTTGDPITTAPSSGSTGCPMGQAVLYADGDGDGWGAGEPVADPCQPPPGAVDKPGDCDDTLPAVNPGASEQCNAIDDDCDGLLDEPSPANTKCDGCTLGVYKDRPYWACQDPRNHADAELRCQSKGAGVHLAVADDVDEHGFLRALALASFPAPPSAIHFYLGLSRPQALWDDCTAHTEEAAWQTFSGAPAPFLSWSVGEPNNSGCDQFCTTTDIADAMCMRENCVEMVVPSSGTYNDNFCGVVHTGYLCEVTP